MSLINPAILYGLGLAAIPVILHFLLRSKPKKLLFPALRLIVVRRKNNVRRMRLRHLWLLLLRILVIALLVLAITRPSLPAANYGLNGREWLTLAAIAVAAAAVYFALAHYWRRQRLSNHEYAYRRSLLRGGTGLVALFLVLVLVGWPYRNRVLAEITAPMPNVAENVPVAGVFLFDTSLSMAYQLENRTRLGQAQQIALEHLSSLPSGSQIAVADTSTEEEVLFQADLIGAKARIEGLEIRARAVPLNERLRSTLRAQQDDRVRTLDEQASIPQEMQRDRFLREIYVFTDLSASGWRMAAARNLRRALDELDWVHVYLIDVGVTEPTNFSVSPLRLSRQTVPLAGELFVTAGVDGTGTDDETRMLELYLEDMQGTRVKKGQKAAGPGDLVEFPVRGLTGPVSRGEVRLVSSDPLEQDDVRYFTVAVRPPPEVLVVYESHDEALYWIEALSPGELSPSRARYRVKAVHVSQFGLNELTGKSVVCLVNLAEPAPQTWNALSRFVEAGGGLFVVLGNSRIKPAAYNDDFAQSFLPARLVVPLPFTPTERLDLGNLEHPLLRKFDAIGGSAELSSVDVHWYYRVKPHAAASVVVRYTDWRTEPALLERVHGDGRTLMLTTAIDRKKWTDLPSTGWPFFILADQVAHYLSRQRIGRLNYTAGETVFVALDPERPISGYLLQKPGTFQQLPGDVAEGEQTVSIDEADRLGNYTLIGRDEESSFATGFSVNPDAAESDFARLNEQKLNALFGEGRFDVARGIDELTRRVSRGRIGQEMFPLVLAFALLIFCGEHFVANRFYQAEQAPEHR